MPLTVKEADEVLAAIDLLPEDSPEDFTQWDLLSWYWMRAAVHQFLLDTFFDTPPDETTIFYDTASGTAGVSLAWLDEKGFSKVEVDFSVDNSFRIVLMHEEEVFGTGRGLWDWTVTRREEYDPTLQDLANTAGFREPVWRAAVRDAAARCQRLAWVNPNPAILPTPKVTKATNGNMVVMWGLSDQPRREFHYTPEGQVIVLLYNEYEQAAAGFGREKKFGPEPVIANTPETSRWLEGKFIHALLDFQSILTVANRLPQGFYRLPRLNWESLPALLSMDLDGLVKLPREWAEPLVRAAGDTKKFVDEELKPDQGQSFNRFRRNLIGAFKHAVIYHHLGPAPQYLQFCNEQGELGLAFGYTLRDGDTLAAVLYASGAWSLLRQKAVGGDVVDRQEGVEVPAGLRENIAIEAGAQMLFAALSRGYINNEQIVSRA